MKNDRETTTLLSEKREAEYVGEDGLRYCGICHEPREKVVPGLLSLFGTDRRPRLCRCQQTLLEAQEQEERERKKQERILRLRELCFQGASLADATFAGSTVDSPPLERCRRYAEAWAEACEAHIGLLLWGPPGTGKSFAAACVANHLLQQEIPVRMIKLTQLLNCGFREREDTLCQLLRVPLLIIDDYGMERETEYSLEIIFSLLDGRMESGRPLILTTNLTLEELRNPTDLSHARIYERIRSQTVPVCFPGESLRKRTEKASMEKMKEILSK